MEQVAWGILPSLKLQRAKGTDIRDERRAESIKRRVERLYLTTSSAKTLIWLSKELGFKKI
jgi:hypothetical protein